MQGVYVMSGFILSEYLFGMWKIRFGFPGVL